MVAAAGMAAGAPFVGTGGSSLCPRLLKRALVRPVCPLLTRQLRAMAAGVAAGKARRVSSDSGRRVPPVRPEPVEEGLAGTEQPERAEEGLAAAAAQPQEQAQEQAARPKGLAAAAAQLEEQGAIISATTMEGNKTNTTIRSTSYETALCPCKCQGRWYHSQGKLPWEQHKYSTAPVPTPRWTPRLMAPW